MWFAESDLSAVGRVTPDGRVEDFRVPLAAADFTIVGDLTSRSDASAAAWFTVAAGPNPGAVTSYLGRVTASGSITLSPLPSMNLAEAIAAGDGGELWVGGVGMIWKVKLG